MPENILLTGGRAPATLHLARMLSKKGHRIYIADTFALNLSASSRYIKQYFKVPSPRFSPQRFKEAIIDILKKQSIQPISTNL